MEPRWIETRHPSFRCVVEYKRTDFAEAVAGKRAVVYSQFTSATSVSELSALDGPQAFVWANPLEVKELSVGHIMAVVHDDGRLETVWQHIDSSD